MVAVALSFVLLPLLGKDKKRSPVIIGVIVALPAIAIGLYLAKGSPDAPKENANHDMFVAPSARDLPKATGEDKAATVESLLGGLERRLEANPDDAKGWLLLAKSYRHLGENDKALAAYEKARNLGQADKDFEASMLDVPAAGSAPVISDPVINDRMISASVIKGRLAVSESARERIAATDSVFIFAKSVNGPPMPVAALRLTGADLPVDFQLSDDQAMTADRKLSTAGVVVVTARVSRTGNAMQAEPGLEVSSKPINVSDNEFVLLQFEAALPEANTQNE